MERYPKSWLDRLLGAALMLAVAAWLLRWAWQVLQSLLPVGLGLVVLSAFVCCLIRWRRNRYW